VLDAIRVANDHEGQGAELVMGSASHHPSANAIPAKLPDRPRPLEPPLVERAQDVGANLKATELELQLRIEPIAISGALRETEPLQMPQTSTRERRPRLAAADSIIYPERVVGSL